MRPIASVRAPTVRLTGARCLAGICPWSQNRQNSMATSVPRAQMHSCGLGIAWAKIPRIYNQLAHFDLVCAQHACSRSILQMVPVVHVTHRSLGTGGIAHSTYHSKDTVIYPWPWGCFSQNTTGLQSTYTGYGFPRCCGRGFVPLLRWTNDSPPCSALDFEVQRPRRCPLSAAWPPQPSEEGLICPGWLLGRKWVAALATVHQMAVMVKAWGP